ncbi:type IV pilin [Halobacterium sp. KA-4]|uniref:type IV pilin n=1 Tax=Halobacterium sp. KA-4 TaxID=2896367 RepID=UPI001E3FFFF0|nr:archaellin/type IV pilin N-terminal domain-containing protein [Halobacterium sp. KA-4]MCD2199551.1 type IV pilin [Halobacterium sp. KA-4]
MRAGRAVSPVVGVALMVAITVVLAATVLVAVPAIGDIEMPSFADGDSDDEPNEVQTELIRAADGESGKLDDHYIRVHIEEGSNAVGNSLNQLHVAYPSSADASNVTGSDVERVGIDKDGDGVLEADAMVDLSGLSTSDDGSTLDVTFNGNHNIEAGDWIVLDVSDVQNPAPDGEYNVSMDVNGDVTKDGVLTIE